jgi:hypothetical protein
MPVYWITYRFADAVVKGRDRSQRVEDFTGAIADLTGKVWAEPAAFVVFEADASIAVAASLLQDTIEPEADMFLIHEIDGEEAIICGSFKDPDILEFMPHLKTLV